MQAHLQLRWDGPELRRSVSIHVAYQRTIESEAQVTRRWIVEKRSRFRTPLELALYSILGYLAVFGMLLILQFSIDPK
jgi:hypothetical protein